MFVVPENHVENDGGNDYRRDNPTHIYGTAFDT